VPIPPNLETEGNLSKAWKQWRQIWDAYETVANLKQRESSYRVATFITSIGTKALEIHTGLPFENEAEKNNIDTVLKLWEDHCQ
jgi:deferrochelatase/peroxidase EfeB